jgi:hypothetical protein
MRSLVLMPPKDITHEMLDKNATQLSIIILETIVIPRPSNPSWQQLSVDQVITARLMLVCNILYTYSEIHVVWEANLIACHYHNTSYMKKTCLPTSLELQSLSPFPLMSQHIIALLLPTPFIPNTTMAISHQHAWCSFPQ